MKPSDVTDVYAEIVHLRMNDPYIAASDGNHTIKMTAKEAKLLARDLLARAVLIDMMEDGQ